MADMIIQAGLNINAPSQQNLSSVIRQINNQLKNGINTTININTGKNGGLNTLNNNLNNTSKAARQAASDIEKFGAQAALAIRRYGAFTLATTGFIKLIDSISAGVKEAIEFDREIIRVGQVTGYTTKSVKALSKDIFGLSKEYGVSAKELLKVTVTLSQAGLTIDDVKTSLAALAKTGVSATFGDMGETAEGIIAIFQQFGVKANEIEGVLSSINKVSAKYAVESEDIITAVRRSGAAFQAAGGNLNEFLALFTSVRQTTRESAETIATGFRTIFTRLQRVRTQNFLENIGIQTKDANNQFVGPYEAIKRISQALKDLPSTDPRFSALVEELGGFRQVSKVIPLLQKFDVAQKALNDAIEGGNSLTEDAARAQESLSVQIEKVKQQFQELLTTLSNNVVFRGTVQLLLDLSSAAIKLAESLDKVLPLLVALGVYNAGSGVKDFYKGFKNHISGLGPKKFASGGYIPGNGNKDDNLSLLMDGEYVLNKKAVKRIGVSTLNKLNSGNVKKYAKGGPVGGSIIGGIKESPLAQLGVLTVLQGVVMSFSNFDKEVQSLSSKLGETILKFGILNTITGNLAGHVKNVPGIGMTARAKANARPVTAKMASDYTPDVSGLFDYAADNKLGDIIPLPNGGYYVKQRTRGKRKGKEGLANSYNEILDILGPNPQVKKQIKRRAKEIEQLEGKYAKQNTYVALGGAAAGFAGDYLYNSQLDNARAGKNVNRFAAVAGAGLSGAGQGAALGMALGPYGAVIGGIIGLFGSTASAINELSDAMKQARLDKQFTELKSAIDAVNSGQISATSGSNEVIQRFKELQSGTYGDSSAAANDTKANLKGSTDAIATFFSKVAEESQSFDEFNQKTQDALYNFATLKNLPFDRLKKQIEDQIKAQNDSRAVQVKVNRIQTIQSQLAISLNSFNAAINKATENSVYFDNALDTVSSTLDGQFTKSVQVDLKKIFEQAKSGGGNVDLASKFAKELTSSFGSEGGVFAKQFNEVLRAMNELPQILLTIASENGNSKEGDFAQRFEKSLNAKGFSPEIIGRLLERLDFVKTEADKDEIVTSKIRANVFDVADDLSEGFKELLGQFERLSPAFESQAARIQSATEKYAAAQYRAFEIQMDIVDRQSALDDFLTEAGGGSTSLSTLIKRVTTNPSSQLDNIRKARIEQIDIQNRLSNTIDPAQRLIDETRLQNLNLTIRQSQDALKRLADDTTALSAAQEELTKIEESRKFKLGLAESLVFGTGGNKREAAQAIVNARNAAQNPLSVSTLSPEQKKSLLEFLKGGENTVVSNGKTGKEILDSIYKAFGVPNSVTQQGQSTEAQAVINEYKAFADKQIEALGLLADDNRQAAQDITNAIASQNQQFLNDLKNIFLDEKIGNLNKELSVVSAKLRGNITASDKIAGSNVFGGMATPAEITDFSSAVKLIEERVKLESGLKSAQNEIAIPNDLGKLLFSGNGTAQSVIENISKLSSTTGVNLESRAEEFRKASKGNALTAIEGYGNLIDSIKADLINAKNERIGKAQSALDANSKTLGSTQVGKNLLDNYYKSNLTTDKFLSELRDFASSLNGKGSIQLREETEQLTKEFAALREEIKKIEGQKTPTGRASGGFIYGNKNVDGVNKKLTPGEFVLNKQAAATVGQATLTGLNSGRLSDKQRALQSLRARKASLAENKQKYIARESARKEQARIHYERRASFPRTKQLFMGPKQSLLTPEQRAAQAKKDKEVAIFNQQFPDIIQRMKENEAKTLAKRNFGPPAKKLTIADYEANIAKSQKELNRLNEYKYDISQREAIGRGLGAARQVSATEATSKMYARQIAEQNAAQKAYNEEEVNRKLKRDLTSNPRMDFYNSQQAYREKQNRLYLKKNAGIPRFADGGVVGGSGNKDNKLGLLTPGEFVVKKSTVNKIGSGNLEKLNNGGGLTLNADVFRSAVQQFSSVSDKLSSAISQLPNEINLNARHTVEVIFNGAESLSKLLPELENMAVLKAKEAINNVITSKFPDVGQVQ